MNIFLNQGDTHHFQYPSIEITKKAKTKKPIAVIDTSTTSAQILHLIWKNAFPKKNISPPKATVCFHTTASDSIEKQINFLLLLDSYKLSLSSEDKAHNSRFQELASFYSLMSSSAKSISDKEIDSLCDNVKNLYIEEKSKISSTPRSKVFTDCALKASAFQAGIRALVKATEEPTLLAFKQSNHLNGVCILTKESAVIKKIFDECRREEQRLIEQLFLLRNLEGIVPQYFIKEMSRSRFGMIPFRDTQPFSSFTCTEQGYLLKKSLRPSTDSLSHSITITISPSHLVNASVHNKTALKLESALAIGIDRKEGKDTVSPIIAREHGVTAQPLKHEMLLFRQLKAGGLLETVLSRLTHKSQYSLLSLLEMQPLDLHYENIGFQPSKSHLTEELRAHYDTVRLYVAGRTYTMVEYILLSLKNPPKDSQVVFISLREDSEPMANTFDFANIPWELVLFDTDHFFFESSDLMKMDYYENPLHQIPLRFEILGTTWAAEPINKELIEKLKCPDVTEKTLRFFEHKLHPVLQILLKNESIASTKASIASEIQNLMRAPKYSISYRRLLDRTFTMQNLRASFEDDLAKAACETTKKIWTAIDAELPDSDNSLASDTLQAKKIRSELIKGIFPKLSLPMIDEYKKRCDRRLQYLTDFEKLQNSSKLTEREQKALLNEILDKESTPLFRSTRIYLKELLKKPKALATVLKKCLSILQPSFLTIAISMYPILGDVWELLPEIYITSDAKRSIDRGAAVGNYMISLEEVVARYLLEEFLPNQHLISDPRVLSLTLQFKKKYSISYLQQLDTLLTEQGLGYGSCHFACKRVVAALIKAHREPDTVRSFVV